MNELEYLELQRVNMKLADIGGTLHAILEKLSEIQRILADKDRFTG